MPVFTPRAALRCAAAIAFSLSLAACDEASDVPYVPEPSEGPSRADCEEVDFAGGPLQGPAFVDGVYAGPTDAPLVASSTVLYLRDTPEAPGRMQALMNDIVPALGQAEGLLGVATGTSPGCGAYRTLALWRDAEAMGAFVVGSAHLAAMQAAPDIADRGTRTVHWTFDPAAGEPGWAEGIERTDAAAELAGLGGDR